MRPGGGPPELPVRARPPEPARRPVGPLRRSAGRYGWRAYAIPLLTVATVATLVDLVVTRPAAPPGSTGAAAASTAASAAASTAASAAASTGASVPRTTPAGAAVPAQGEPAPTEAPRESPTEAPAEAPATVGVASYAQRGAGTLSVVDGTSAVYGTGPLRRFIVEVEDGIGVEGRPFAQAVETTLGDPRSWGSGGRLSFQRVGAAEAAAGAFDFTVSLVSPGNMETYCPGVGTGGYTSCRYGARAVINLARWATAVPDYAGDVATYRRYVVNHEVGHALGNGHQDCPGAGQVAPVMQQQTLGLAGCVRNAWPFP